MAQFVITVENKDLPIFLGAFGYVQTFADGTENPEAPEVFLRRTIKGMAEEKVTQFLRIQRIKMATATPQEPPEIEVL